MSGSNAGGSTPKSSAGASVNDKSANNTPKPKSNPTNNSNAAKK